MNNKVSIIVPVYNSEKYLERCIDSLVNQNYQNIEIILVNDGSTDNSENIIKKYSKIDNRIKIITQQNQGPNIARKKGVELSSGNYLMFVDSDDYIHKDTVNILMNYASDYDVVYFGLTYKSFKTSSKVKELNQTEIRNILLSSKKFNSLCTGFYKKELFENINNFDIQIKYAEDYLINLEVLSKVNKLLLLESKLYYYQSNDNSTTKSNDLNLIKKNFEEFIFVHNKLYDYLIKWQMNNETTKQKLSFYILDATRIYIYTILRKLNKNDFLSVVNIYLENDFYNKVRNNFNINYIKNKNPIYRIKNSRTIKNLYYKKYKNIWKLKKWLIIKDKIIK